MRTQRRSLSPEFADSWQDQSQLSRSSSGKSQVGKRDLSPLLLMIHSSRGKREEWDKSLFPTCEFLMFGELLNFGACQHCNPIWRKTAYCSPRMSKLECARSLRCVSQPSRLLKKADKTTEAQRHRDDVKATANEICPLSFSVSQSLCGETVFQQPASSLALKPQRRPARRSER